MGIKDVLLKFKDAPLEQSIAPVAEALAASPVLIAAQGSGDDLQFQVAADKQGLLWIYVYSDQAELSKAFPGGASFVEMKFVDTLATVGPDERFGGIFINSKSEAMYVIPRAAFGYVYKLINPNAPNAA